MTSRPYHHNNLRTVLLERAAEVLRTDGVDKLSLRELARHAGVSHGAPRSHFIDRQALLDALAVRGFEQLTDQVGAAIEAEGSARERFGRVARTYITFASREAALMELMFATKMTSPTGPVHQAATRLFVTLDDALIAPTSPSHDDGSRDRFKMLFAASVQGAATLIASHRVSGPQADQLIEDAIDLLFDSDLGRQSRPT